MTIKVIAVRGSTVVVQEHSPLLALLYVLEVTIMRLLPNLDSRCCAPVGLTNTPRQVNRVTLHHFEIRRTDQGVRAEHDVEVRIARYGQSLVGLVAIVMPELSKVGAVAADQFEGGDIAFLECLVAGGEHKYVNGA